LVGWELLPAGAGVILFFTRYGVDTPPAPRRRGGDPTSESLSSP